MKTLNGSFLLTEVKHLDAFVWFLVLYSQRHLVITKGNNAVRFPFSFSFFEFHLSL